MYYDPKALGKRIKILIKYKETTAEDLATFLGVHLNTVYNIQRGNTSLTVDNLLGIADYFNVTIETILFGGTKEWQEVVEYL